MIQSHSSHLPIAPGNREVRWRHRLSLESIPLPCRRKLPAGNSANRLFARHHHGQAGQTPSSNLKMSFPRGSSYLVRPSNRTGARMSGPLCATGDTQHPKAGTGHAIGHYGELLQGRICSPRQASCSRTDNLASATLRAGARFFLSGSGTVRV